MLQCTRTVVVSLSEKIYKIARMHAIIRCRQRNCCSVAAVAFAVAIAAAVAVSQEQHT